MALQFPAELLPMAASMLLCFGIGAFTWRYREKRPAMWLMFMVASVIGWTAVYSLQVMLLDKGTKLFVNNFRYIFVSLTTVTWFLFVLSYTDREEWITPRTLALVLAIPAITQPLIWTNQYHGLIRQSTDLVTQGGIDLLEIGYGSWFWVHAVHAYIMVLAGVGFLVISTINTRSLPWQRGLVLTFAVLVSFVPAVAEDFHVTVLDYTPVFLSVTMFLVGYALLKQELLDVIPVARKTVVEEMRDGIFVLDDALRIIDYNPTAEQLLEAEDVATGRHLDDVTPFDVPDDPDAMAEEISLAIDGEQYVYSLNVTPIQEHGEASTGWLVVMQDITEIKNRERELELLNRVVRHDIQNDMNVVRGYAERAKTEIDDQELVEPIIESSEHAIELTETVRDLLETITGDVALEREPVDLWQVLESELEKARATHTEATFAVDDRPETPCRVIGNSMISSIFTNLFRNAVRHHDGDSPEVTVSVAETGDSVRVSVADDGPGVPGDKKEEIFGRGAKGLDSPGTGIGLYLVDTLVDQYGGSVHVEDNEPRGAVFVVEFQRAETGRAGAAEAPKAHD